MDCIQDDWFRERVNSLWPGQQFSLRVKKVLFNSRSEFQDILIFESETYGTVLVLDGVIQTTQFDEFVYHEMMAYIPLSFIKPKKALVIGGGDGGVVRELVNYCEVVLCEIDPKVIEVSLEYLPYVSKELRNKKVEIINMDGFEYLKSLKGKFDIIVTDSTDPVSCGAQLFRTEYFEYVKQALSEEGVLCSQGECKWLHEDLIKNTIQTLKTLFVSVGYASCSVPSYPCGQMGFFVASNRKLNFIEPKFNFTKRHYNRNTHIASFLLNDVNF